MCAVSTDRPRQVRPEPAAEEHSRPAAIGANWRPLQGPCGSRRPTTMPGTGSHDERGHADLEIEIKPGRADDFKAAAGTLIARGYEEPDTLRYDQYQSTDGTARRSSRCIAMETPSSTTPATWPTSRPRCSTLVRWSTSMSSARSTRACGRGSRSPMSRTRTGWASIVSLGRLLMTALARMMALGGTRSRQDHAGHRMVVPVRPMGDCRDRRARGVWRTGDP